MIFDATQIQAVKQGRITAAVIPASQHITTGRVKRLRIRSRPHDENSRVEIKEAVTQVVGSDPTPVVATILSVRRTTLFDLAFADARACGYKTTDELREAWKAKHPRTHDVQLVTFAVGDVRDRPRFLAYTRHFRVGVHGDFTASRARAADDAEVLEPEVLERYAARAASKRVAERGNEITKKRIRSLSVRLKDVERQWPNSSEIPAIRGELEAIERENPHPNRLAS